MKDKIDLKQNKHFIICGKTIDILTDQFNKYDIYTLYIYDQLTFNNIVTSLNIKDFNESIVISPTIHLRVKNKIHQSIYDILTNFDSW